MWSPWWGEGDDDDDDAFKSKLGIEPSVGPIPSDGRVLLVVWGRVYGLVLIQETHVLAQRVSFTARSLLIRRLSSVRA